VTNHPRRSTRNRDSAVLLADAERIEKMSVRLRVRGIERAANTLDTAATYLRAAGLELLKPTAATPIPADIGE